MGSIHTFSTVRTVLQQVGGLAVQLVAEAFQRAETHRAGLAGLKDGEVGGREVHPLGQVAQRHLPLGHHHIKVYDYHLTLFVKGYVSIQIVSSCSSCISPPILKI